MARSTRKPFGTCRRFRSCKTDRRIANKGVRQASRRALQCAAGDFEDFLSPDKYECSGNCRWTWNSDGTPSYQLDKIDREWSQHCLFILTEDRWYRKHMSWPPAWHATITRK